jgi:hypothetical protein
MDRILKIIERLILKIIERLRNKNSNILVLINFEKNQMI